MVTCPSARTRHPSCGGAPPRPTRGRAGVRPTPPLSWSLYLCREGGRDGTKCHLFPLLSVLTGSPDCTPASRRSSVSERAPRPPLAAPERRCVGAVCLSSG